jgi:soluble cytochrome b562
MVVEVKKEYENFYQVVGAKIQIMQIDGVSSLLQEGKTVEVNYAGEMRSLLAQS